MPLLSCIWISPNTIIAGGHGCVPLLFNLDGAGQISFVNKLEEVRIFSNFLLPSVLVLEIGDVFSELLLFIEVTSGHSIYFLPEVVTQI